LISGISDETVKRVKRQSQARCDRFVDLTIIVDTSNDFQNGFNWPTITQFIRRLIEAHDIGFDRTRVAIVRYSRVADLIFNLDRYFTKDELYREVDNIDFTGGQTNTADALMVTRTQAFSRGDRPSIPNIAILITAGRPTLGVSDTLRMAEDLKQSGVTLLTMGITNRVDQNELRQMSTNNNQFIYVPDFFTLQNSPPIMSAAVEGTCPRGSIIVADNLYCMKTSSGLMCFCATVSPPRSVNGTTCDDINECTIDNGGCDDICINLDGSYECRCGSGLRLGVNRHECEDVNECDTPGICGSSSESRCVNVWSAYYCIVGVQREGAGQLVGVFEATATGGVSAGIIVGILVAVFNMIILIAIAAHCLRSYHQKKTKSSKPSLSNGHSNGAFRSNGTIRSFHSLASRFSATTVDDSDTISTASTISSLS
jgi:hypothetical protein